MFEPYDLTKELKPIDSPNDFPIIESTLRNVNRIPFWIRIFTTIPAAFFCGIVVAGFGSIGVSDFEGGSGFAAFYLFMISVPVSYIVLLFVHSPKLLLKLYGLIAILLVLMFASYFIKDLNRDQYYNSLEIDNSTYSVDTTSAIDTTSSTIE